MPSVNLTPEARDKIIRVIMGEAGGEPVQGMQAVAWVIRNRYDRKGGPGKAFARDLLTPDQFNSLDEKSPANLIAKLPATHPLYQRVGAIVDNVFDGNIPDPTKGATHFFNPRQALPSWANTLQGQTNIGGHRFGIDPTFGGSAAPTAGAGGLTYRPNVVQQFSPELQGGIDALKASLAGTGIPIDVVSGYRDPEHNAAVGGARGSQHMSHNAIDIALAGLPPEQQKMLVDRVLGVPAFRGFGYYPKSNSIHVDVRPGARVAWGSDYSSGSVGQGWQPWMLERVNNWRNAGVLGGGPNDTFPMSEAHKVTTERIASTPSPLLSGSAAPRAFYSGDGAGNATPLTVRSTPLQPPSEMFSPTPLGSKMPSLRLETMESPIVEQPRPSTSTLTPEQIASLQTEQGAPVSPLTRTGPLSSDEQRQLADPNRYGVDPKILAQLRVRQAGDPTTAAKLAPLSFGQIGSGPLNWLASLFGAGTGSSGSASSV
jgi:N-acetylmuramoyl-L-alanine amidase